MAKEKVTFKDQVVTILNENGLLFTIFTIILIVFTGLTLVNNPSQWWVPIIGVLLLFLMIFIFLNARVLIKSSISILLMLLAAGFGFRTGSLLDPTGIGGSIWLFSTIFTYLITISYSYLSPSSKSRWGITSIGTILGFITINTLGLITLNVTLSVIIGTIINIIFFLIFYKNVISKIINKKHMPIITVSEELKNGLEEKITPNNWGMHLNSSRKGDKGILVWNDKHVYMLAEVLLDESFSVSGDKKAYLTYKGKNISNWLIENYYKRIPLWNVGDADILLVLLDTNNKNGKEPKTIGIQVPDSKNVIPVGIMPTKTLTTKEKYLTLVEDIDQIYSEYIEELSTNDRDILDSKLPEQNNQN